MRLKNKKTGEIIEFKTPACMVDEKYSYQYDSLAELNEEWEDYEEPIEYWFIDEFGLVQQETEYYYEDNKEAVHDKRIAVGNHFETKEEAEKALERLKALQRLKDKGFRFIGWRYALEGNRENGTIPLEIKVECNMNNSVKDLDLLFGGEE